MSKVKRNTLSLKQKNEIINLICEKKENRKDVAKQFNIAECTLSKIIKNKDSIKRQHITTKNLAIKRNRKPQHEKLNTLMSKWFEQVSEKGALITGTILLEKLQQFADQLGLVDFKANVGWLHRWKKREQICFKRLHGEAASANVETAESFKQNVMPEILKKYDLENIFNADETGLFYKALPNGTFIQAGKDIRGRKMQKDRITLLLICNATGSKKFIYCIGKYKSPRCFRNKSIPLSYKFNKQSWMTATIWSEIIKEIDDQLNKKILLLIDNAPCHKLSYTPKNIEIMYLPAQTTSLIQPLDQGIIHSLKAHYRTALVRKQVLAIEADCMAEFYKEMNLLKVLHMVDRAWRSVSSSTIKNCFRKCGLTDNSHTGDDIEIISDSTEIDVQDNQFLQICAEEDEECFNSVSEEELLNEVLQSSDDDDDSEIDEIVIPKPNRSEALKAMFLLKNYIDINHEGILLIEKTFYNQSDKDLVQKKINDYYHNN